MFDTDRIGPLTHPGGNFSIGGIVATLSDPAPMPTLWWLLGVATAALLGYCAAYRAERAMQSLLAITVVGLLSCAVPPLAWGSSLGVGGSPPARNHRRPHLPQRWADPVGDGSPALR